MNFAKPLLCAVALASLSLPACGGTPGEDEGQTAITQQPQLIKGPPTVGGGPGICKSLTANGLTTNGLTNSALTGNAVDADALTDGPLTAEALLASPVLSNSLGDPLTLQVLGYIVSCALSEKQSVNFSADGNDVELQGQIGLAKHWGRPGGHCDKSCQEWVSACVLARLDFAGQHVDISVRGANPHLKACPAEVASFAQREATYYGNVFASPQRRFACLSPGATQIPRVCGPTVANCVVDVVGSCANVCEDTIKDGAFRDCRPGDADKDDPEYHSITVFLKP
jgi:hypothetical protein